MIAYVARLAWIAPGLPCYPNIWRHLSATRFALAVAEGQDAAALEQLEREARFYRLQAEGAFTMIEKLIAVANLNTAYGVVNQYLALHPDAARQHASVVAALLPPP